MSKLVQTYIKDYINIKYTQNIDSDAYNNLLLIDNTINNMLKSGSMSAFEHDVIMGIISGYNFSELSTLLKVDRQRVSVAFKSICNRIAFILGGSFSDLYMIEKLLSLGVDMETIESKFDSSISELWRDYEAE